MGILSFEHFSYTNFTILMQIVQLTNVFLHAMAMKETKITAQDSVLCDPFLKMSFRVLNNAHFKLS